MYEPFTITVSRDDESKTFDGELRVFGYSHKIAIMVDGTEILFEPDEERNYRAVLADPFSRGTTPGNDWLPAIADELTRVFK